MTRGLFAIIAVVAVVALILFSSLVVVNQTQQAVILQFGALVRVVKDPGLTFIVPGMQNVRFFD